MDYVYMIICQDNSYYTGITKDVKKRMRQHFLKEKNGAKYTKSRQAVSLAAAWKTGSWSEAGRLEYFIKSLTRKEKELLVKNPELLAELFGEKKKEEPPDIEVLKEFGAFPISLEKWFPHL